MKKTLLFITIAALILSSCQNEELTQNTEKTGNNLTFGVYVNKKETKVASTTNATFSDFKIYGYKSSSSIDWSTAPTLFISSVASRTAGAGDATWTTIPVPWPASGQHVRFYGISPATVAGVTYSVSAVTGPIATFTTFNDTDLLMGQSSDITALASSNPRISMSFTHALSKISFSAKVSSGLTAYISGITIEGLYTAGTYNFLSSSWSGQTYVQDLVCTISSVGTNGVTATTNTNITDPNGAIFSIPQTRSAWSVSGAFNSSTASRLKITYSLKNNADGSFIVGTGSAVGGQTTAYLPIAFTMAVNTAYTVALSFGDGSSASGGGGYTSSGTPIIDSTNLIQLSTTFTDWTDAGTTSSSM